MSKRNISFILSVLLAIFAGPVPAASVVYGYDALDRLIEADDQTVLQRFEYDNTGNRTTYDADAVWVPAEADYRVVVDPLLTRVEIGQIATVKVTAENIGATAINDLTLSVSLTPILRLQSIVSNDWTCQQFGQQQLVCTLTTLAAGQTEELLLHLVADTLGFTDVLALLSASEVDSSLADNTRLAMIDVLSASDLNDRDNDLLPDDWELQYGLDFNYRGDTLLDSDLDGLSNFLEWQLGTRPNSADSDGDQMPDTWEYASGLDPLDSADAQQDPDGDGLTNLQEYQQDSNPLFNPSWMNPVFNLLL